MKGKILETSSIIFSGQKLRSKTSATLSLILNGAVSASLISPSSFEVFGRQAQDQTSTYAGNILSSYGNPCKLNPCPSVCYLHAPTKGQGKETWALPKNLTKAFEDYLAKEGCLEDPFSKNKPSGTINPVYLPLELLNNTKNVSINKTLSITTLAQYFYPATLEAHPINNHDLKRALF